MTLKTGHICSITTARDTFRNLHTRIYDTCMTSTPTVDMHTHTYWPQSERRSRDMSRSKDVPWGPVLSSPPWRSLYPHLETARLSSTPLPQTDARFPSPLPIRPVWRWRNTSWTLIIKSSSSSAHIPPAETRLDKHKTRKGNIIWRWFNMDRLHPVEHTGVSNQTVWVHAHTHLPFTIPASSSCYLCGHLYCFCTDLTLFFHLLVTISINLTFRETFHSLFINPFPNYY